MTRHGEHATCGVCEQPIRHDAVFGVWTTDNGRPDCWSSHAEGRRLDGAMRGYHHPVADPGPLGPWERPAVEHRRRWLAGTGR